MSRRKAGTAAVLLLLVAGTAGTVTKNTTTKTSTPAAGAPGAASTAAKPSPAAQTPAAKPAPNPDDPAVKAISQMAFLSGKWEGKVDQFPFKMDIAIQGAMEDPGPGIVFQIHATPGSAAKMGIEGDYKSRVNYSEKHGMLRAIVVDLEGRGVEMVGNKVPDQPEWQFDSTPDGAPFPFKVRLIPKSTDQIVVNYTTGGRLPLKYEVTFNRVES